MALSNAERQKRHREKQRAKAGSALVDLFERYRLQCLDDMAQQCRDDGEEDEAAFMMSLRNEVPSADEIERAFESFINGFVNQVAKENRRAWDRRSRAAKVKSAIEKAARARG